MAETEVFDVTEQILSYGSLNQSDHLNPKLFDSARNALRAPNLPMALSAEPSFTYSSFHNQGPLPSPFRPFSAGPLSQNRLGQDSHDSRIFKDTPRFHSQLTSLAQPFRANSSQVPLSGIHSTKTSSIPSAMMFPKHGHLQGPNAHFGGKSNPFQRKNFSSNIYGLCELCFKPVGHHSKTCPQFVREQEEKELRKTRVNDDPVLCPLDCFLLNIWRRRRRKQGMKMLGWHMKICKRALSLSISQTSCHTSRV